MSIGDVYRIKLMGNLDSSWGDQLSGMRVRTETNIIVIEGHFVDEASLSGFLDNIGNTGLTLLSVEIVDKDADKEQ